MKEQNFDLERRIGTRAWLQASNRYSHMMDLIGYDVYLNGDWKYLFSFDSGWSGDAEKALDDAKIKLEECGAIHCVYNSLIDGDIG